MCEEFPQYFGFFVELRCAYVNMLKHTASLTTQLLPHAGRRYRAPVLLGGGGSSSSRGSNGDMLLSTGVVEGGRTAADYSTAEDRFGIAEEYYPKGKEVMAATTGPHCKKLREMLKGVFRGLKEVENGVMVREGERRDRDRDSFLQTYVRA